MTSPRFHLTQANVPSLCRSAAICAAAIAALVALKYLFPSFNWIQIETAVLTVITAWMVNTVKETVEQK
jgi:hypothetical protein